jgi:hypothetical protein
MNTLDVIVLISGVLLVLLIIGISCGLPLGLWLSQKMTNVLMFLPTEKFARPVPQVGKAAGLAIRGEVEKAALLYESFLSDHPEEKELYLYLLELALGPLQDEAYAGKVLMRADENLEYESDREAVRQHAEILRRGELIPLRHLGWCQHTHGDHPKVRVPEMLKGRMFKLPDIGGES